MHLLYIDESGCLGSLPAGQSSVQPLLVVCGLFFSQRDLPAITGEWADLKQQFFPDAPRIKTRLDWQLFEPKGADLRRAVRSGSRRQVRHAIGFLDKSLSLLQAYDCRYVSKVFLKVPNEVFKGNSAYTSAVQRICEAFHRRLCEVDSTGMVIADHRMPHANALLAHSVFTQKYRRSGDPLPRILEIPTFGHSQNHAGLQLADLIASALLFPMCAYFFGHGHIANTHVSPEYDILVDRYAGVLKSLQFRYSVGDRRDGGLVISDPVSRRGANHLFAKSRNPVESTINRPESHSPMGDLQVTTVSEIQVEIIELDGRSADVSDAAPS